MKYEYVLTCAKEMSNPIEAVTLLVENCIQAGATKVKIKLAWLAAADKLIGESEAPKKVSPVQNQLGFQQCLTIVDNGRGMSPELFTKVFNSFAPGISAKELTTSRNREHFGTKELGISLKLACFRLGKTALVLSRSHDFVSIALISAKFQ